MQGRAGEDSVVSIVQALASARDPAQVIAIVRSKVRGLIGCDGVTFVLREGEHSYYVDEDAIGPLFKGMRFPLNACVGGACILEKRTITVFDVASDARVPAAAYEPTFVKSLVMVPIRSADPLGAIGAYWATPHLATPYEIELLTVLADSVSLALANVQLILGLEEQVRQRTHALREANRELDLFAGAVAHDLRAPLSRVCAASEELLLAPSASAERPQQLAEHIRETAIEMSETIGALLRLSRVNCAELKCGPVDLSALAHRLMDELHERDPARKVEVRIAPGLSVHADAPLLQVALQNLLSNAWKYSTQAESPRIEVGAQAEQDGSTVFVRDNGVGFDARRANELFVPFSRLQTPFPGIGIGLVTVARVAAKHGGRVWAESEPGHGATFFMWLPRQAG